MVEIAVRYSQTLTLTFATLAIMDLGPDLQNILRQSYDYLTIMLK